MAQLLIQKKEKNENKRKTNFNCIRVFCQQLNNEIRKNRKQFEYIEDSI